MANIWMTRLTLPLLISAVHGQEVCHTPSTESGSSLIQVGNFRQRVAASSSQPAPSHQGDYSFTAVMEQLNRTRHRMRASTPMLFTGFTQIPDPVAYKAAVTNQCCTVHDCAVQRDVTDCSADTTYACDTNQEESFVDNDGVLKLAFGGKLSGNPVECGEADCEQCTKFRTCAGPSAESAPVSVVAGECVRWEFKSTGQTDWYEIFIGLYDAESSLITNVFERGKQADWKYMQLAVSTDATVHLKVMLASYDYTGGTALGADLSVRNVETGRCLPDECLKVAAKRCCYTGGSAPLTEVGYSVLGECCCNMEMEDYIRRVAADEELEICLDSGLQGLVPWFTCEHGLQSLAMLRTTLQNVLRGVLSPECPWLAPMNSCPATLPDACFAEQPADPTAHRRRSCPKPS